MKNFYILAPDESEINEKYLFFVIDDPKLKKYKMIKYVLFNEKIVVFRIEKTRTYLNKKIDLYEACFNEKYKSIIDSLIKIFNKYKKDKNTFINLWYGQFISAKTSRKIFEEICEMLIKILQRLQMEFYKYKNILSLKISENDFLTISPQQDICGEYYICTTTEKILKKSKKIDLYEIAFDEKIKEELIKSEKYIPLDIIENCMKCYFYSNCKYDKEILKNYEKTNKILKEYKDFIKSIKGGD